jgi:hypothetical protein
MNTKTEAERLADEFDADEWIVGTKQWASEAANELRRLNFELQCANAAITARDKVFEANAELLEALHLIRDSSDGAAVAIAKAAIAKHSKEQ